jgi:hypothetical protein
MTDADIFRTAKMAERGHRFQDNIINDNARVQFGDNYYNGELSSWSPTYGTLTTITDGKSRIHIGNINYQSEDRCLVRLHATDPRKDKTRIEQKKGGLLEDSYRWILNHDDFRRWRNEQSQLLWIKGDPGKGKTMLLCGIIDNLIPATKMVNKEASELLSYFFCEAADSRTNNATAVLRGLIYLLVDQQPSLLSHVQKEYDCKGKSLFEDANAWVALSEIFTNILEDANLQNTYLIIDALDECTTDRNCLLDLVVQKSSAYSRVKWIVSSRNWPDIEEKLDTATQKVKLWLELNEKSISTAVSIYIEWKVKQLADLKNYDDGTRDAVQRHLSSNANDTFLWVALVCQELGRPNVRRYHTLAKLRSFPPGLDDLYSRMMVQICDSEDAELCKRILAVVSVVYQPIMLDELACFVDMPDGVSDDESLVDIIALCGSFLTLRERTITFVHQSAKDYLVKHASAKIFPNGHTEEQQRIVNRFLSSFSPVGNSLCGRVVPIAPNSQARSSVNNGTDVK